MLSRGKSCTWGLDNLPAPITGRFRHAKLHLDRMLLSSYHDSEDTTSRDETYWPSAVVELKNLQGGYEDRTAEIKQVENDKER